MDYFTKNLQTIRKTLLLSQVDMAEKMNVSYRAYSSYERGERKPDYTFLQNMHDDFNVNLNFLICGKGEMFLDEQNKIDLNKIDKTEFKKMFMECMKETGFI